MTEIDLESALESAGRRTPVADLPQQWLPNGFYTITFPCGTHKTFRIHTQKGGPFAGRRLVSLLIGPVNTADYEAFGELTPSEDTPIFVWKRFKNKKQAEYAELLILLARGGKLEGYELQISKRCIRCNRELTTPESLEAGIGPECRKQG